jgi:hypothetical protein
VFAGLGAAGLVLAFAFASLMPPATTLAEVISRVDHGWLLAWQAVERSGIAAWLAAHLASPLLARPVWLLPAGFGLVCTGTAISLGIGREPA